MAVPPTSPPSLAVARFWGVVVRRPGRDGGHARLRLVLPALRRIRSSSRTPRTWWICWSTSRGRPGRPARGARRTARRALRRARGAIADEQAALRRVATLVAAGHAGARAVRGGGRGGRARCWTWTGPASPATRVTTRSRRGRLEHAGIRPRGLRPGKARGHEHLGGGPAHRSRGPHRRLRGQRARPRSLATRHRRRVRRRSADRRRGSPLGTDGRLVRPAGRCPPTRSTRLTDFTELVATAIANAEARAEVERLAEEQAALRRVATLVARGVTRRARSSRRWRARSACSSASTCHAHGPLRARRHGDRRRQLERGRATTCRSAAGSRSTARASRRWSSRPGARRAWTTTTSASGAIAALTPRDWASARRSATPIVVEGRLWGVMIASSERRRAAARRHGVADRRLHGAGGHGDVEHRGTGRADPARRRSRRRCGAWRRWSREVVPRASSSTPSPRRSAGCSARTSPG